MQNVRLWWYYLAMDIVANAQFDTMIDAGAAVDVCAAIQQPHLLRLDHSKLDSTRSVTVSSRRDGQIF